MKLNFYYEKGSYTPDFTVSKSHLNREVKASGLIRKRFKKRAYKCKSNENNEACWNLVAIFMDVAISKILFLDETVKIYILLQITDIHLKMKMKERIYLYAA